MFQLHYFNSKINMNENIAKYLQSIKF